LYANDWEGPTQIFAVDPTGRGSLGQVTFDHAPACIDVPYACGFTDPLASANGKTIAYTDAGEEAGNFKHAYWVADASGRGAHEVATPPRWYHETAPYPPPQYSSPVSVVSPNRRWIASVDAHGITVTGRRNGDRRVLTSDSTFALSWAPNSKSIAYIQGGLELDWGSTGDLKVVSLSGRTRTLVRADGPYGGQIVALAWTRVPKRTAYRRPLVPMPGLFVGGPVGRLAAGGSRVAFTACGNLSLWVPPNPTASTIARLPYVAACPAPDARDQYFDLAVSRDRVFWGEKTSGLSYDWSLHARTLSTGDSVALAAGFSALGCPSCDGAGALAASGDLMVFGRWHTALDSSGVNRVTTETLFRGTDAGCPCTAIAYAAAPESIAPLVPLDTDGSRIAALRYGSIVMIDRNGDDVLTTGVAGAGGAQIIGNSLLVLTEHRLTEYDIGSSAVQHSWPVPGGTPGRDCHYYSEPHCPYTADVKLQDAARGLAAYTVNGQLHILHLNGGADTSIGYATEARFTDTGLVFADGARINFISNSGLGAEGSQPASALTASYHRSNK
jgi:hypothetical protein